MKTRNRFGASEAARERIANHECAFLWLLRLAPEDSLKLLGSQDAAVKVQDQTVSRLEVDLPTIPLRINRRIKLGHADEKQFVLLIDDRTCCVLENPDQP